MRTTLAGMAVAVLLAALGLAALTSSSVVWASAAYSVAVGTIGVAVLGGLFRRGRARRFWVGYAVFGWCYWSHGLAGPSPSSWPRWGGVQANAPPLLPDVAFDLLADRLPPRLKLAVGSRVQATWKGGGAYYAATIMDVEPGRYRVRYDDGSPPEWVGLAGLRPMGSEFYRPVGHALVLPLVALAGGLIGRRMGPPGEGGDPPSRPGEGPVTPASG